MAPPPIALFMTTIASQPALRQRQEYVLRTLQVMKIPYTTYDLASDEDAKRLWRRKAPPNKQLLPGILVGGKFPGTIAEFEDAVEHDELDIFLRRGEEWDPSIDEDRPMPEVKPVGVPGAYAPLDMTPEPLRKKILAGTPTSTPLKKLVPVNKRTNEIDIGENLGDHGLEGVKVTRDELRALIEELGLAGDDAGDLVRGLSDLSISRKDEAVKDTAVKVEAVKVEAVKVDAVKDEAVKDEAVKDEAVKDEAVKDPQQPKNSEPQGGQNAGSNVAASNKESAADEPEATNKAPETEVKAEAVSESASSEAESQNK